MKSCEIEQDKNRVSILQSPNPPITNEIGRRSSMGGSRIQKKKIIIQVETCIIEDDDLSYPNIQYEIFVE